MAEIDSETAAVMAIRNQAPLHPNPLLYPRQPREDHHRPALPTSMLHVCLNRR